MLTALANDNIGNASDGIPGGLMVRNGPCRLVRQVKEIPSRAADEKIPPDPCHLVWQVSQIQRLASDSIGRNLIADSVRI